MAGPGMLPRRVLVPDGAPDGVSVIGIGALDERLAAAVPPKAAFAGSSDPEQRGHGCLRGTAASGVPASKGT